MPSTDQLPDGAVQGGHQRGTAWRLVEIGLRVDAGASRCSTAAGRSPSDRPVSVVESRTNASSSVMFLLQTSRYRRTARHQRVTEPRVPPAPPVAEPAALMGRAGLCKLKSRSGRI